MLKKNQKQSIVSLYSESLNSSPSFILINFAGTKVSEFEKSVVFQETVLQARLRPAGQSQRPGVWGLLWASGGARRGPL